MIDFISLPSDSRKLTPELARQIFAGDFARFLAGVIRENNRNAAIAAQSNTAKHEKADSVKDVA